MPKERIFLIEDHHEAFWCWKKLGIKDAPLVHIDAHIDFGFWIKPAVKAFEEAKDLEGLKRQLEVSLLFELRKRKFDDQLNIGNYIYPAMRDGIVNSFQWIIPGGKKEHGDSAHILRRQLKSIRARDPYQDKNRLYGKDFKVIDIYSVKEHNAPILLDVDVDYLLFDSLKETPLTKKIGKRGPWLYPDRFVTLLKKKFPQRICTTIAYSVNGGFTPILYKFFGDEIALRLTCADLNPELEKIFILRNKGIESYSQNDMGSSFKHIEEAVRLLCLTREDANRESFRRKFFAHLNLWLYNICWKENRRQESKGYYHKALDHDPTLRVTDNNFGWLYLRKRCPRLAQAEFEKIVFCDPIDHNALRGIGDIDFASKRYTDAKGRYAQALALHPDDKRALAGLAECHLRLDNLAGTEGILKRLKKIDPLNGRICTLGAELLARKRDYKKSLALYKEAVLTGAIRPDMYKNIFRILKIEKDEALSKFFSDRYAGWRKLRKHAR